MKQTAVEWLIEQLKEQIKKSAHNELETKRTGDYRIGLTKAIEFCEQAKEMEKEQQGYSDEEVRKAIQLARLCTLDGNTGEFVDLSGLTEVCTYGLEETHSENSIIEQFKKK